MTLLQLHSCISHFVMLHSPLPAICSAVPLHHCYFFLVPPCACRCLQRVVTWWFMTVTSWSTNKQQHMTSHDMERRCCQIWHVVAKLATFGMSWRHVAKCWRHWQLRWLAIHWFFVPHTLLWPLWDQNNTLFDEIASALPHKSGQKQFVSPDLMKFHMLQRAKLKTQTVCLTCFVFHKANHKQLVSPEFWSHTHNAVLVGANKKIVSPECESQWFLLNHWGVILLRMCCDRQNCNFCVPPGHCFQLNLRNGVKNNAQSKNANSTCASNIWWIASHRSIHGKHVLIKINSRPGDLVDWTWRQWTWALILCTGVPNTTSLTQEMDQSHGLFESNFCANLEVTMQCGLEVHESVSMWHFLVGLSVFSDEDCGKMEWRINSFIWKSFCKRKCLKAWTKVGAPVTCACLSSHEVWHKSFWRNEWECAGKKWHLMLVVRCQRARLKFVEIMKSKKGKSWCYLWWLLMQKKVLKPSQKPQHMAKNSWMQVVNIWLMMMLWKQPKLVWKITEWKELEADKMELLQLEKIQKEVFVVIELKLPIDSLQVQ